MPRPAARIDKGLQPPRREPNPDRHPDHKANIKQLPCVVSGKWPVDPHHCMGLDIGHGTGKTVSDQWLIPLHREVHDRMGREGKRDGVSPTATDAWLAQQGIDGRACARALWAARLSLEGMHRVALRFYQAGVNYRARQGQ